MPKFGLFNFVLRRTLQLATTLILIVLQVPSAMALLTAEARPHFKEKKIKLGDKIVTVEIADSDEKREYGLMFREHLPDDHGMLFIFDEAQMLSFWMKNTIIPLSIGYFDAKRSLLETHEMAPPVMAEARLRTYPSHAPALYALEMPKNWFHQNSIRSGTTFTFVGRP